MFLKLKKAFIFCVLTGLMNCFGTPPQDLPEYSRVVAEVGPTVIKEDLLRFHIRLEVSKFPEEIQNLAKTAPLFASPETKPILLNTLDKLIQNQVVLNYGAEKDLLMNPEKLKEAFEQKKRKWLRKELESLFEEKDITYSRWKKYIETEIQTQHVLHGALVTTLQVTPKEIKTYYVKNRKDFQSKPEVRVRHIVTNSHDKAVELQKRILAGENFAKLALDHSISPDRSKGGDLGYFSQGSYPKVFDECFRLKKGEVSDVISSDYGHHIFKVLDKKPGRRLRLDEAASKIYQILFDQKLKEQYQKWLELQKQKTTINIHHETLQTLKL